MYLPTTWFGRGYTRALSEGRVGAPAFRQNDATESERIVVTFIGRAHVSPLSYLGASPIRAPVGTSCARKLATTTAFGKICGGLE